MFLETSAHKSILDFEIVLATGEFRNAGSNTVLGYARRHPPFGDRMRLASDNGAFYSSAPVLRPRNQEMPQETGRRLGA